MKMSDNDVAWHFALWIGFFVAFCAMIGVYPLVSRRVSNALKIAWLLLAVSVLMAFLYMFLTGGLAGGFLD